MIAGECEATGEKFVFDSTTRGRKQKHPLSPSLDQRAPAGGYTKRNTMVVCWKHNCAKHESTWDAHLRYCAALLRNNGFAVTKE